MPFFIAPYGQCTSYKSTHTIYLLVYLNLSWIQFVINLHCTEKRMSLPNLLPSTLWIHAQQAIQQPLHSTCMCTHAFYLLLIYS